MPQNTHSYDFYHVRIFAEGGEHMQQYPAETAQGRFDASLYDQFAATIFTYLLIQVQNEQDAQYSSLEPILPGVASPL